MRNPTFINYRHPSEQSNRQNRRTVASYIGTHYRNRSRPSARKALNPNDPPTSTPPAVFSDSGDDIHGEHPSLPIRRQKSPRRPTTASNQHLPAPNLEIVVHDKHGFRSDPFNAYPIEFRACIPAAIDFCKYGRPYKIHLTEKTNSRRVLWSGPCHQAGSPLCKDRNSDASEIFPVCSSISCNV